MLNPNTKDRTYGFPPVTEFGGGMPRARTCVCGSNGMGERPYGSPGGFP